MSEPTPEQKKIKRLENKLSRKNIWLGILGCVLFVSLFFNIIGLVSHEESRIGVVHPETNEVSGETIDIVNAGYFWNVYNNVDSEKTRGTIYNLFSEEEILELLMDKVLELEYNAVSSPSSETTRYRIEDPSSEGGYIWIEAPASVEEKVPDTTGEITG